ncbi:MAG: ATP-binding cassette domain-containing protein [Spirochaetaceae bacterium]|jgi:ABC-2 type transport system ATP-binding protein|nr:ATP-binding cassette domain-containing protein [Spirochaetaceae bacterium]
MISVSNLHKKYGAVDAVRDVSFTVDKDSVLGFLGPNGAGKTTIMKILTGYHFPSAGTALVDGISVTEDPVAVKSIIGYLPESVPLYSDLTVEEYLRFIARARLIPRASIKGRIDTALELCALGDKRGKRIETLSKGYKQRTGLAQAILHDPPILILDEPTTGLDPNQIIEIRGLIKDLGKRKTVILSTHILQEVEAVCNQVLILNEGAIAAQGTPESIAGTMKGGETWDILLKSPYGFGARDNESFGTRDGEGVETKLGRFTLQPENITVRPADDKTAAVSFFLSAAAQGGGHDTAEAIFDWAVGEGLKILSMTQKKLSLEDIFVKLTNEAP